MTYILSSKLMAVAFPALAVILSLCVSKSKCLSTETCTKEEPCAFVADKSRNCFNGKCVYCESNIEDFNETTGECMKIRGEITHIVTHPKKTSTWTTNVGPGFIVAGIFLLLAIIGGIVGSCFCCPCCAGYQCRKRQKEKADQEAQAAQASQMMMNPAYSNQQMQSQYQSQYAVPPPGYTQYPNGPVQGGNGPAAGPAPAQ